MLSLGHLRNVSGWYDGFYQALFGFYGWQRPGWGAAADGLAVFKKLKKKNRLGCNVIGICYDMVLSVLDRIPCRVFGFFR